MEYTWSERKEKIKMDLIWALRFCGIPISYAASSREKLRTRSRAIGKRLRYKFNN